MGDLVDLIELCKVFRDMGDAIAEQLDTIARNGRSTPTAEYNVNAFKWMREWLNDAKRVVTSVDVESLIDDINSTLKDLEYLEERVDE